MVEDKETDAWGEARIRYNSDMAEKFPPKSCSHEEYIKKQTDMFNKLIKRR